MLGLSLLGEDYYYYYYGNMIFTFKFQALKSSNATTLKPGRNTITVALPPQKPGSYVLGVLTGQIGQLRFRSHSFSKGGPADSDDFMSYEKPTRPILKVVCFSYDRELLAKSCSTTSYMFDIKDRINPLAH